MKLIDKLNLFIEDINRYYDTPVNLPRYSENLTYQEYKKKYCEEPKLDYQIPQCHICTRFETDDNPLFAYSFLENENGFRFIYRCLKGHGHENGLVFIDVHTGLGVYY